MLRLAQPSPGGLSGWLGRAVSLPAASAGAEHDEASTAMVVTGLQRTAARH
jgi:hypothetical protein